MSDQAPDTQRPPRREHEEGGLLAAGTKVAVTYNQGTGFGAGTVLSIGATPTAYIVLGGLNGGETDRRLIFCTAIDYIEPYVAHPATG